jgi:hypothetical protein
MEMREPNGWHPMCQVEAGTGSTIAKGWLN